MDSDLKSILLPLLMDSFLNYSESQEELVTYQQASRLCSFNTVFWIPLIVGFLTLHLKPPLSKLPTLDTMSGLEIQEETNILTHTVERFLTTISGISHSKRWVNMMSLLMSITSQKSLDRQRSHILVTPKVPHKCTML
jgi:hypothetical protein